MLCHDHKLQMAELKMIPTQKVGASTWWRSFWIIAGSPSQPTLRGRFPVCVLLNSASLSQESCFFFFARHITCVILYLRTAIVCNGFTPLWWFHILGQRCDWAWKGHSYHLRHPIQLHPLASNWGLNWSWPQGLWVEGMMADLWVIDIFLFWIFDCSPQGDGWRLWISFMTQKILDSHLVRCNQKIKDTHSIKAKRTSFPHSFFRSSWTTPTSWTTCSSLESSVITTIGGSVTIEM